MFIKKLFENVFDWMMPLWDEDGGSSGAGNSDDGNNDNDNDEDDDNEDQTNKDDVDNKQDNKLPQDQVTKIAKRERSRGKRALLQKFGFETEDEFEEFYKANKKSDDKNDNSANVELENARREANTYKNKLECINNEVQPKYVDTMLAMFSIREDKELELDEFIEEQKESHKFMFVSATKEDEEQKSTGKLGGSKKKQKNNADVEDDIGKRLAEKKLAGMPKQK